LALASPWIPVEPNKNPAAILGPLPFRRGSVTLPIPSKVVPATATGILVFAWAALAGKNAGLAYWHMAVEVGPNRHNFFSLLVAGDPTGSSVMCNSQAFWLPMPRTASLIVTLHGADLMSSSNKGEVEIHGYSPGASGP
jgi:hypothetical protein